MVTRNHRVRAGRGAAAHNHVLRQTRDGTTGGVVELGHFEQEGSVLEKLW